MSHPDTPVAQRNSSNREVLLLMKIDLAEAVLPHEQVEQLATLLADGLTPISQLTFKQDHREAQRLAVLRERLAGDGRYGLLMDRLQEVLEHLTVQNSTAAKERAALLLDVLKGYYAEVSRFNADAKVLNQRAAERAFQLSGLAHDQRDFVTSTMLLAPYDPPPGAGAALRQQHDDLYARLEALLQRTAAADESGNTEGVRQQWLQYKTAYETYEKACESVGRAAFLQVLGMPSDVTEAEFAEFQRDVLAPIPGLSAEMRAKPDAQVEYARLCRLRTELAEDFLLHMRDGFPAGDGKEWAEQFLSFMAGRVLYEKHLTRKEPAASKWLLYAGIVINELGEEVAEEAFAFSKESLYRKHALKIPFVAEMDALARKNLFAGWETTVKALAARGVPTQSLGNVFWYMNRSPMGPKFWAELLKVESPLTVLMWGAYLSSSQDKIKASIQFFSFIGISNASNKLLGLAETGLRNHAAGRLLAAKALTDPVQRAAALAKAERHAERMKTLARRIPGNAAVKFGAAIGLAVGLSHWVERGAAFVDDQIPDSEWKHNVEVFLSIVSSEAVIGHVDEALESLGVFHVNPMGDQMEYLADENVIGLDRERFHTLDDWNARVDQVIAAEEAKGDKANAVAIRLFSLQKIDDPQRWADRQSVTLFTRAGAVRTAEVELAAELVRRNVIAASADLNGWAIATSDGGEPRNDREVDYAFGVGKNSPGLAAARKYFDDTGAVPESDPLRKQWIDYVAGVRSLARDVSVLRHLGFYTQREDWLGGTGAQTPPRVLRGMVEDMAAQIRWDRETNPDNYPGIPRPHFERMLREAMRMKAHDAEWNQMVSTGVAMGGTYMLFRYFKAMGSQGRFAQTTFAQFLDRIPGVSGATKTLNGIRRTATYPFTRTVLGAAPEVPGASAVPRKLIAVKPEVELHLRELERTKKLSRTAADGIRRSKSAQDILEGAMRSKNPVELQRCVRNANRAVVLTRSVAAVGMAADAFGVYMAFVAYRELEGKIDATDNAALKDLYRGMQRQEIMVGSVSAVCLTINGIVFVTGAAGGVLAVASVATLPIALAVAAGKYASDCLYEVAETWTKNGVDWAAELSPTDIARKLVELAPGAPNFWQNVAVLSGEGLSSIDGSSRGDPRPFYERAMQTKETANEMTRVALAHAYFIHTLRLPPAANEDRKGYDKRVKEAINDAMRYLLIRTDNVISSDTLSDALLHAQLCDRSRLLRYLDGRGELDQPEYVEWTDGSGAAQRLDLCEYEKLVNLLPNAESQTRIPVSTLLQAYRTSINADYALFLNASKPLPGERLTPANRQMVHQFIQGQLLERLEPHITIFRGKLYEYYDGISVSDMSNLGKTKMFSYMLYQQIRYRLAANVQVLLDQQTEVTPEDIEAIFQKMVQSLAPREGYDRKFRGLEEEVRRTHLGAYETQKWQDRDPFTLEKLRANILWDTESSEFQQFALAHPWLVGNEVVSKDMLSGVGVLREFLDDRLREYRRSPQHVSREWEFRFLMSYAQKLDANPGYDPDGSFRALIRSLDRPDFYWTSVVPMTHPVATLRTHAMMDVFRRLQGHVQHIDSHREYFDPPVRATSSSVVRAVVGSAEPKYSMVNRDAVQYVQVPGMPEVAVTKQEALAGREFRNAEGKAVGTLRCSETSYGSNEWWFDVSGAEVPADLHMYGKGAYNGIPYERSGLHVVSRMPVVREIPILPDGGFTFDVDFFYKREGERGYGGAHNKLHTVDFHVTEDDNTEIDLQVLVGFRTENGVRVPDPIVVKKGTTDVIVPGYKAEYFLRTASGVPAVKLSAIPPRRMQSCTVRHNKDEIRARIPSSHQRVPIYSLKTPAFVRLLRDYTGGAEPPEEALTGTNVVVEMKDGTKVVGSLRMVREGRSFPISYIISFVLEPDGRRVPFAESSLASKVPEDFLEVAAGWVNVPGGGRELGLKIAPKPGTADVAGYEVRNPTSGYHAKGRLAS